MAGIAPVAAAYSGFHTCWSSESSATTVRAHVQATAPLAMATRADLEVEGAVDAILLRAVDGGEVFRHRGGAGKTPLASGSKSARCGTPRVRVERVCALAPTHARPAPMTRSERSVEWGGKKRARWKNCRARGNRDSRNRRRASPGKQSAAAAAFSIRCRARRAGAARPPSRSAMPKRLLDHDDTASLGVSLNTDGKSLNNVGKLLTALRSGKDRNATRSAHRARALVLRAALFGGPEGAAADADDAQKKYSEWFAKHYKIFTKSSARWWLGRPPPTGKMRTKKTGTSTPTGQDARLGVRRRDGVRAL